MNYLAHIALAPNNDNARIGNYLGDFVKGREDCLRKCYKSEIVDGIMLHRKIDYFTDTAPEFIKMTALFKTEFRRISPIIVDVMLDHLLIRHWEDLMPSSLENFIESAYKTLYKIVDDDIYPEKCRKFTKRLIERDAFRVYSSMDGIHEVLCGINRRLKNRTNLPEASHAILQNYVILDSLFMKFFPQLQHYTKEQ
ncbi:MAG: DUF479 domain-containing protein [Lentisphaerae bacterium]|nr:DUF479 domain-containing protein [Lentisphaerota bacterium]MCP4102053.1 DUF479 domain-containing protein [Lentisphaerota bacterium]